MLRLKNINTYYGKVHALKNVSLHLAEGELVTLIGANGAGKTTILNPISRVNTFTKAMTILQFRLCCHQSCI